MMKALHAAEPHPTQFYVDCRLYRPTNEEAEFARRSLAADKVLPLPSEVPPQPKAIPPKPQGLLGKAKAFGKDMVMNAVSEFFGSAGGKGDPDVGRQCAELYGLFQRKNIMEAPTDAVLRINRGAPKGLADLEDDKAPGGLFLQHTASHQWYHCFILGKKEDAQLQCVAMDPDELFRAKGICGAQACDFDRSTFKTECLTRVIGLVGRPQCVYVGHHMELHPKDIMGKPVPYSVYILSCPPLPPPPVKCASRSMRGAAFLEVQSDPNNGNDSDAFARRKAWDVAMKQEVSARGGRPWVWIGDLNVAADRVDVTHPDWFLQQCYQGEPEEMRGQPGFTKGERRRFQEILKEGRLVDSYRHLHPVEDVPPPLGPFYTWRGHPPVHQAFAKYHGKGMRIDYALIAEELLPRLDSSEILGSGADRDGFLGSDHCPIRLRLKKEKVAPVVFDLD